MAVFAMGITSDGGPDSIKDGDPSQQIFRTTVNRNYANKTPVSAIMCSIDPPIIEVTYSDGTTRNVSYDLSFTCQSYGGYRTYGPYYSENGTILTLEISVSGGTGSGGAHSGGTNS